MQEWGPQTKSYIGSLVQHGFYEALYTWQKSPAKKPSFLWCTLTSLLKVWLPFNWSLYNRLLYDYYVSNAINRKMWHDENLGGKFKGYIPKFTKKNLINRDSKPLSIFLEVCQPTIKAIWQSWESNVSLWKI